MISISVKENLKHIFYLKCNIVENSFFWNDDKVQYIEVRILKPEKRIISGIKTDTMRLFNMKRSTGFFRNEHPAAFSLFINKSLLHLG